MTDTLDWPRIADHLNAQGWAVVGPLLTPATCYALQALYDQPVRFRSRILMPRHGFGQGEISISPTPCPIPCLGCGRGSMKVWRPSPTAGPRDWSGPAFPTVSMS